MKQIGTLQIREHLAEILNSNCFQTSPRLKDFLSYIVEVTLSGKTHNLKAYTIATDVFKLGKNFDPRLNPLVRTEAGRLRNKLAHYYLENPASKIRINIPKGGYVATFCHPPQENAGEYHEPTQKYSLANYKIIQPEHKTTLMVLPFMNINKTEEVELFILGLVSEIITGLTHFSDLKIIEASSTQQLADTLHAQPNKTEESLARFILKGNVQNQKKIFKVWVRLIDSNSNQNIWSEKFYTSLYKRTLLDIQEDIADSIVSNIADDFGLLQRTLLKEYTDGSSLSSDIQEATLLYYQWTTVLTKSDYIKAVESVERACKNHPEYVPAQAMLADLYAADHSLSYDFVENALEKSMQLATNAVKLNPACQLSHLAMCHNYSLRSDSEKFLISAEKALEINPASTNACGAVANWYAMCGFWEKALELSEKILLSHSQYPGWCYSTCSMYYLWKGDYALSLANAKKIAMPNTMRNSVLCMAAAGYLDDTEECKLAKDELLITYPDFMKNGLRYLSNSFPNKEFLKIILIGLDKASNFNLMKVYEKQN